jgi:hypothetical protein
MRVVEGRGRRRRERALPWGLDLAGLKRCQLILLHVHNCLVGASVPGFTWRRVAALARVSNADVVVNRGGAARRCVSSVGNVHQFFEGQTRRRGDRRGRGRR